MKRSVKCENNVSKKSKLRDKSLRLKTFVNWSKSNNIHCSNKVRVSLDEPCAKYGMMAVADIKQGECLFTIPREILLLPDSCGIGSLLKKEQSKLESSSGWVPLLLALMYEYTSPCSKWQPYIEILPQIEELDLPMFWDEESRDELLGTGILGSVDTDISSMQQEFHKVALPFIQAHVDLFRECTQFEFYKHMVAIIMAYSFTEPESITSSDEESEGEFDQLESNKPTLPVMVPMADILNHISKNNAHLDFDKESLKMVAVTNIKEGEEIFNTYGELSNFQLLHMYGFAEKYPENQFDLVEIPIQKLEDVLQECDLQIECLKEKLDVLKERDILTPENAVVVGADGIESEDIMVEIFQVLSMKKEEFEQYKQSEAKCESESLSLGTGDIPNLSPQWKNILELLTECALQQYRNSTIEAEEQLLRPSVWNTLSKWQQYATYVRYGQKKLLFQLNQLCKKGK